MKIMEETNRLPEVDDLVRAVYPGIELKRSDSPNEMPTLVGFFAVFNVWTEIDSLMEGHFMERFASGCFSKTISENRDRIQVLFDHGEDPSIGKKVLGPIKVLREEGSRGGYYEVPLLDTSYTRDLLPGLKAGLYGSSFRFKVIKEDLTYRPKPSAYNPKGLPERTVTEARIREFGPVTFPVYEGATSGVRSMTDQLHGEKNRTSVFIGDRTATLENDSLYKRSRDLVGNRPWAIHPSAMETMIEILSERVSGYRPSNEEIKARIGTRSSAPVPAADPNMEQCDPICVIDIMGTIMPHGDLFSQMSGAGSIEDYQAALQAALDDPNVQHIVLNIDSPGGAVSMVPEFAAQLLAARAVKPITAVANTSAFSAAYWLASQATDISVTPSGAVGSVGVITAHQDVSAAMDALGVKTTTITAGKYKGELSPLQPLSEEAQNRLQQEVDAYYEMFVGAIAKGRGTTPKDVNANFGQGRTVMAKDAVAAGMADRVESMDAAMKRLRKQYGVAAPKKKKMPMDTPMMISVSSTNPTIANGYSIIIPTITTASSSIVTREVIDGSKEHGHSTEAVEETGASEASEGAEAVAPAETEEVTDPITAEQTSERDGNVDSAEALVETGAGNAHSSATSRESENEFNRSKSEEINHMPNTGMTIEEVKARLDEIKARQKEIVAEFGTDPFTDAVKAEWDTMIPEREELIERVRDYESRQNILRLYNLEDDDRHKELVEFSHKQATPAAGRRGKASRIPENIYAVEDYRNLSRNTDELGEAYRDGAMRAIEVAHFAHPDARREDVQGHVAKLLEHTDDESRTLARRILTTSSPTYQRAFTKHIAGAGLTAEEQRSLSLTGSGGGYAVPIVIDPTVILTSNGVLNPIRQLARVETIVGNTWTGVSSAGVVAAYSAEAAEAGDAAPSFSQPTANVEKAQAFIPFSIEIGEDWGALQSEMALLLQDAKDTLESNKFLTGAGHASNVPQGLLVGATVVVSTAATATFAVADLYSLESALAPRWRPRASIVSNRAQYNKIRQFDTAGGASLWVQLQNDLPPRLVGYPAYEWSDMSSAGTSGASIVTIGDFSQFLILDRVGMNIELVPLLLNTANNRPDGTRGLYAYWRNTSTVLTNAAFKTLKLL